MGIFKEQAKKQQQGAQTGPKTDTKKKEEKVVDAEYKVEDDKKKK